jgi:aspartyl-tRNA(Asn)/glutamyl-tRNA(Gln) amidotransferase subunit C
MSDIDEKTVRKIAELARIEVKEDEIFPITNKLKTIMNWIEQLGEVNTDDVEPMTSVLPMALKKREDVISDSGYPEKIIKNAPVSEDHFFVVPKVVE